MQFNKTKFKKKNIPKTNAHKNPQQSSAWKKIRWIKSWMDFAFRFYPSLGTKQCQMQLHRQTLEITAKFWCLTVRLFQFLKRAALVNHSLSSPPELSIARAVTLTQEVNNPFVICREQSNGIFEEEHEGSINYTICKFIAINLGRSEKKLIELDWSLAGKLLVKFQHIISRQAFQSSHWLLAESNTITNSFSHHRIKSNHSGRHFC